MVLDRARTIRLEQRRLEQCRVRIPIVGSPADGLRGSLRDVLFVPHLGRLGVTIEPRTTDVLPTCVVIARGRVRLPRPFASDCSDAGLRPREAGRQTVGGIGQRRSVGADRQRIVSAKSKERIACEVRVAL